MANVSKRQRQRRPPKPEFRLTGIIVGAFAGEALAVIVEFAVTGLNRWVMLTGGGIGGVLGAGFEGWRYWKGNRRWQHAKVRKTGGSAIQREPEGAS